MNKQCNMSEELLVHSPMKASPAKNKLVMDSNAFTTNIVQREKTLNTRNAGTYSAKNIFLRS